jgi:hypothetical protein
MSTVMLPNIQTTPQGVERNGLDDSDSLYEVVRGKCVRLPPMGVRSTWLGKLLTLLRSEFFRCKMSWTGATCFPDFA